MQYAPMNTTSTADLVNDLQTLAASHYRTRALADLASRCGFAAAIRAYDAGLTVPVLADAEPAELGQ